MISTFGNAAVDYFFLIYTDEKLLLSPNNTLYRPF